MPMATYKPHNSVPRIWYPGLKDESTSAQSFVDTELPIHAPLFFDFAPKGPEKAVFGYLGGLKELFGNDLTNEKSKYATLSTPYLNLMAKKNNVVLFQRIVPEGAKEATLCLALEVIETNKYRERRRDRDNNMHIEYVGNETDGIIARWRTFPVTDSENRLGQAESFSPGSAFYPNDEGNIGKIYPIFEFKAKWKGEYGNNLGIRLYPSKIIGNKQLEKIYSQQRTCLYEISLLRRDNPRMKPAFLMTGADEPSLRFSLKPETFDPSAGNRSIFFDETFVDTWEDIDPYGNRPPKFGEITDFHIYRENLEMLSKKMLSLEISAGNEHFEGAIASEDMYLIDILTGTDGRGHDLKRTFILDELSGNLANLSLNRNATHFLQGGADGEMNNEIFDREVRKQFQYFGQLASKFKDMGQFPFKQVYDVGFSTETKMQMITLLGKRQDVNITLTPLDLISTDGRNLPSIMEQQSSADVLVNAARAYPESEQFGTPTYRCVIVPDHFKIIDNPRYRKRIPTTYQIAAFRAEYMSSPLGFARGKGYDRPPYNHVTEGYDLSDPYISAENFEKLWATGMTHFMHKTDKLLFCPGLRTVYKDDTSVLTSDIFMQMSCDVNYLCFQVWTNLTGGEYSDGEIVKRANEMIADKTRGRYDGRYVIVPNCYLDKQDIENGYSWSCRVDIYAPNMKTVMKSFIVSHRLSALGG